MKVMSIILILFSFFILPDLQAQKPHFFIECNQAQGDTAAKYARAYERLMADYLKKAYPCADVSTQGDVYLKIDRDRYNQVTGDQYYKIGSYCNDLPHDYWVHLVMSEYTEGKVMVIARCFKYKEVDCIADAGNVRVANDFASLTEGCKTMSQRLIDMLGKYEICAFQGPVAITISSDLDSTRLEQYSVYCNGADQQYRKEKVIKNHTFSDWKLERKGIPWTEGTMTFYTDEMSKTTEEDGCHKCKSGREGGLITTLKNSMKVKGQGISHESEFQGKKQDDTRVELRFLENGTYLVIAKGTSQPVTGQEMVTVQAEGTCDNQPEQTKPVQRDITVPLKAIFGPYTGKTTDKLLQEKDEKKVTDPVTREQQTITIDFSLKQKEN
jgi:hypothetical protein